MEQRRSASADFRLGRDVDLSSDLVQEALAEICQSSPFRSSRQSQDLIRYIVDQTLAGHGELLKERLIGVNVFGRRPDYDTNEDPIVRARAAEVRKRLAQFYVGEGTGRSVRIEIAPGSYHASFKKLPEQIAPDVPQALLQPIPLGSKEASLSTPPQGIEAPAKAREPKRCIALIAFPILALACVASAFWYGARPIAPIDQFWGPFFRGSNSVILYSGANAVYMLNSDFMNRYKTTHHVDALRMQGREFAVPISPDIKLGADDIVAFTNDFITIGDLSANVRIASLLAMHRRSVDLRCGEDVAFSDLRQSPAVLIGEFNNSWTMELTRDLPFVFQHSGKMIIQDQANPTKIWTPAFTSDGKVSIDYAVVTRMPHSKTGQALITIAGLTQAGTHAAADFVTDPGQLKKLEAIAPQDWSQKNLQLVLEAKVVNNIPTSPVIVATKAW